MNLTITKERFENEDIESLFAEFIDYYYLAQKDKIHIATGGQTHGLGALKENIKYQFSSSANILKLAIYDLINQAKKECPCKLCRESKK